jgi:hypothetical protein
VTEGNTGTKTATFTVRLSAASGSPVTYNITTADATASAGSDYVAKTLTGETIAAGATTRTFAVTLNGDTAIEANESFTVTATSVVGATIADNVAVGNVINDDGPTLSIGDVSISEGNSGTKLATFTVTMSQSSVSAVTYNIATANGTATAGSDYVAKSLIGESIAAGLTSKTFTVTINGDNAIEGNETFTVNLSNASGASIADSQATGTITNDDGLNLSIADVSVSEGNGGTKLATFTVTLSGTSGSPVTYNIGTTGAGTATAGTDYIANSLTGQTIPAGQTTKTFSVTINGDTAIENNETYVVAISSVVGAAVGDGSALGTISNDDYPALSIADVAVSEGNSGTKLATFTVTIDRVSVSPVTFNIGTTGAGSATAGVDYVASNLASQSIPAGQTTKTFSVTINGDTTVENNESYVVAVSSVVGATISDGSALGTITNDDTASVSIADVSVAEGNSGTSLATFTVSLNKPSVGPVTYNIATTGAGTATAGVDYVANSLSGQTIPAGQTSKTFSVTINGDGTVEANETYVVAVSSVVGATVTDGSALGTISNDD